MLRTVSPVSLLPSSSTCHASPSSHKRRKSSVSSDEHRPKKGDEDYVKRPENAFILFRRHCCEERQAAAEEADTPAKKQRQADLSKTISQQWKSLSAEERQVWEDRAKEKKKEHEQLHPNYVYRPQRSKGKKTKKFDEDTDNNISFMLPLSAPSAPTLVRHGRSASAPTPPLGYQSIQLPNVYMPSCPTSPNGAMLRRSSHPGHSEDRSSHFDYLPRESLMPPPFSQHSGYEANLHSVSLLLHIREHVPDHLLQAPQFFTGMFEQSPERQNLPALSMPEPQMMVAPHELMSPSSMHSHSGYSSPTSSPSGPYTPVQHATQHPYPMPQEVDEHGYLGEAQTLQCGSPIDMNIEYPESLWSDNMWANGQEILLGEDFDLNAIPPIELGHDNAAHADKFQSELSYQIESAAAMQHYDYSHDPFAAQFGYQAEAQQAPHDGQQGTYDATYYGMMPGQGF